MHTFVDVEIARRPVYLRRMSHLRNTNPQGRPATGVHRLARCAGRILLWACVLLLLVRGIASYLRPVVQAPTPSHGVTVTVTQPATAEPTRAKGK